MQFPKIILPFLTVLALYSCGAGDMEDRGNEPNLQEPQYTSPDEIYAEYGTEYDNIIEYEDKMADRMERLLENTRNGRFAEAGADAEDFIGLVYEEDRELGVSNNTTRYRRMSRLPFALRAGQLSDTLLIKQALFYDRIWQVRQLLETTPDRTTAADMKEATGTRPGTQGRDRSMEPLITDGREDMNLPRLRTAASLLGNMRAGQPDAMQAPLDVAIAKIKALMLQVKTREISEAEAQQLALAAVDNVMIGQRDVYAKYNKDMAIYEPNVWSERELDYEAYSKDVYQKISNRTSETAEAVTQDEPKGWTGPNATDTED